MDIFRFGAVAGVVDGRPENDLRGAGNSGDGVRRKSDISETSTGLLGDRIGVAGSRGGRGDSGRLLLRPTEDFLLAAPDARLLLGPAEGEDFLLVAFDDGPLEGRPRGAGSDGAFDMRLPGLRLSPKCASQSSTRSLFFIYPCGTTKPSEFSRDRSCATVWVE